MDVCAPSGDLVASAGDAAAAANHADDHNNHAYCTSSSSTSHPGRDRLIHVFHITGTTLVLLNTIDDHSSSVTAVKFCSNGKILASCATDKSIIFRSMDSSSSLGPRSHAVSSKRGLVAYGSIFDLVVDPKGMFALTCGQNRQVTIWDVATANQRRSYKVKHQTNKTTAKREPQTTNHKPQTTNYKHQTTNHKPQILSRRQMDVECTYKVALDAAVSR